VPRKAAFVVAEMLAVFALTPAVVIAQHKEEVSRAELKRLMAHANKPTDYERLASFFHSREQFYRAKAQAKMDDYASCVRNFLVAPKFPTRADQDSRLFDYYSTKADEQAKLAAGYDDLLLANGIEPKRNTQIVSVKDLQNTTPQAPVNAALVFAGQTDPNKKEKQETSTKP
jgi:hypothetical protein